MVFFYVWCIVYIFDFEVYDIEQMLLDMFVWWYQIKVGFFDDVVQVCCWVIVS